MNPTGKSQPQRLLEEVDSTIQHTESEQYPTDPPEIVDAPKFPTIQEQNDYWRKKEAFEKLETEKAKYKANEATRPPRKWSLARRRKFNATVAKKKGVVQEMQDTVTYVPPSMRHCPFCGESIERFLS